jgi:hypothetical protein
VKGKGKKAGYRPEQLEEMVVPVRNRPVQIVLSAFALSATTMGVMTALAHPVSAGQRGLGLVQLLGMLGVALWIGGYVLGFWLFSKRTSREALDGAALAPFRGPASIAEQVTDADKVAGQLRRAWVARAAAWGVGPVICLLSLQAAIQGNLAKDSAVITTGILPMASYAVLLLITWPTRSRLLDVLRKAYGVSAK